MQKFNLTEEQQLLFGENLDRGVTIWENKSDSACKLILDFLDNQGNQYQIPIPKGATCTLDGTYKGKIWGIGKGELEIDDA